eukprot:819934-Pelagomonas_calceolata.AAC.4
MEDVFNSGRPEDQSDYTVKWATVLKEDIIRASGLNKKCCFHPLAPYTLIVFWLDNVDGLTSCKLQMKTRRRQTSFVVLHENSCHASSSSLEF